MQREFRSTYVNRKIYLKHYMYLTLKRLMDIFAAAAALVILAPILLVISCAYLFGENKGPVLFKQKRAGLNGRTFHIYKFRSMVVHAEEKLKKDPDLYQKYLNNSYKLNPEEDPRITKFGRFLRKTSLDELPQFFNVLAGDMSLVGPRPIIGEELRQYGDRAESFLSVKPGITGYWQTHGRSNVGYPERIDIELFYVENKSFKLDCLIILNTFLKVLTKSGAY